MQKAATRLIVSTILLGCVLCVTGLFAQQPGNARKSEASGDKLAEAKTKADDQKRVSVDVARERAKLAQNLLTASLDVMHDQYFHNRNDRTTVPARAMEEVFRRLAATDHIKAKWIAVNATPMSIDHKPEGEFEKQAARAIASGKREFEQVEDGTYRRAVSISLMHRGCLRCHLQIGSSGRVKRFAGLVVSIPVVKK